MQIDSNSAMIDNDFLNHVAEMKKSTSEIVRILSEVFLEFNVTPVIHPLVLKNEVLTENRTVSEILNNVVEMPTFEDIHQNNKDKMLYYKCLIHELYKKLTGIALDIPEGTVFTFWRRRMSLGEIHSMATCLICQCGIFLSDDDDSQKIRRIIEQQYLAQIAVHNRQTVVALLREKGTQLSRDELRSFAHSYS